MDYVDYKIEIRKYRPPYSCIEKHLSSLVLECLKHYCKYNSLCMSGAVEWECVIEYGKFLHSYAEIENLTQTAVCTTSEERLCEWGMLHEMATIIARGAKPEDCKKLVVQSFGTVRLNRHFAPALNSSRKMLVEKYRF